MNNYINQLSHLYIDQSHNLSSPLMWNHIYSNALSNATRCLIGERHKFATVYPVIYCWRYTFGNPTLLHIVAFHWLTSDHKQLASSFMQLAAAGRIGATKYIFTVFLKGKC